MREIWLSRDDVQLRCVDFGGTGPNALILHGLCGYTEEWSSTVQWLNKRCRVIAYDQRGHGKSTRRPADLSVKAYINDAQMVIESFQMGSTLLIGQSMGGRIAFLTAACHPKLVERLVIVEATPAKSSAAVSEVEALLKSWPTPFADYMQARQYFGGDSLKGRVWADSLEEREGGLWPRFDVDVMLMVMKKSAERDDWESWRRIASPVLIIGGSDSNTPVRELRRMAAELPGAIYVSIEGAGHDPHLDQPQRFRRAVEEFLTANGTQR